MAPVRGRNWITLWVRVPPLPTFFREAHMINNPQGAVFRPRDLAWVLTASTEELLQAEAEDRAIFCTDLDKIAATVEAKLAPPPGMIRTVVERERDRVVCLKDPVFKSLELAMAYAQEHPGVDAPFIRPRYNWAEGRKISYASDQRRVQLLDGKFRIMITHPTIVTIVVLTYDPEFLQKIKKNKARQNAAYKYRAKVRLSQALIPSYLLKALVSSFAASIFHHDLKVQFAWKSGVTRESLIPQINKLVKVCQKLKLFPTATKYTNTIKTLEEFIPGLIAHENPEYQVFGKWLRKESHRLPKGK